MKKTLRELLVEHNTKYNYGVEEDSLVESLHECFPAVWQGNSDERRWHVSEERVIKIPDNRQERFFSFRVCTYSGDNSAEDAGFYAEGIDDISEVYPKEVTTTIYV